MEMRFLGHLRDVMSGKIARSNVLIGNHGVRISGKVKPDSSLLGVLVGSTSYCTTDFLVELLFEKSLMDNFKYTDGTEEPNPFKEYIGRLDEKGSYEMFKLVAGNLLGGIFAGGLLSDNETRIDIPELRNRFFTIYEYNDKDKEIFYELLKLAQDGGRPSPEFRLYEYIFKRAYKINPPEYISQIMNFELLFKSMFSQIFLPGLVELMKTANKGEFT
jgi:hypothetical protein